MTWHPLCTSATLRMRHTSAVWLVIAALTGVPGQGAAQRALKDHRFWAVPRANAQRATVWRLTGAASATPIEPGVRLTVLSATRPALPRLSWSQTDVALASAFTVALLVDAGQTRSLARGGWHEFRETNPILGSRPTVGQLNTYTAVAGLSVLGAAAAAPARLRPWLLGAALAVEAFTIAGTAQQGIAIRF
jgi:hypothetical protein